MSGFPCRAGTTCAQNQVAGHWACEPEGGEVGKIKIMCLFYILVINIRVIKYFYFHTTPGSLMYSHSFFIDLESVYLELKKLTKDDRTIGPC